MQVTDDRMIHYLVPEGGEKHTPMRVWFTHERDNVYKVQYRPGGASWTREIFRDEHDLVIRAEDKDFRFSCESGDQLPAWFVAALTLSHSKMDALDADEGAQSL